MTVIDMVNNFEIEGPLRIQRWSDEIDDVEIFYDSNDPFHSLAGRDDEWLHKEIKYMYPTTTVNHRDIEIPQIIIEIE